MYTGMYRDATTNDVSADEGVRGGSSRHLPVRRPTHETGGRRPPAVGPSVARLRARCDVRLEDAVAHHDTSRRRTPSRRSTCPCPTPTAPIGSLIGKMLGRSVRSTMTSACMPGSSDPVTPTQPGHPGAVDGGEADHVARAHQSRERRPCPASLRSKTVACCSEIVARICANMSPGATRSSSTPEARAGCRGRSAAGSGAIRARPPSRSTARATPRRRTPRSRRRPRRRARSRWTSVTSSPRSPRSASSEIAPRPDASGSAWAWMRRPSSRATRPRRARAALEVGRRRDDGSEGDAWSTGPAASGEAGDELRVARAPAVRPSARRGRTRCAARRRRGPGARRRRGRRRAAGCDQSTTVVIPASAAPSSPIRVAA